MKKKLTKLTHLNEWAAIVTDPKRCKSHEGDDLGYIQWFDWADKKAKLGYKQRRCRRCGLWAVWRKP